MRESTEWERLFLLPWEKNSASWPASQECNSPFLTCVVRKHGSQKLCLSIYQVTCKCAVCAQAERLLCAKWDSQSTALGSSFQGKKSIKREKKATVLFFFTLVKVTGI